MEKLTLNGDVLDLGGHKGADYHKRLKGTFRISVANIDKEKGYDLYCDAENRFPIKDETYEAVIALNIFEHVFHVEEALKESRRVLKANGMFIIAVPFLVQVHPSPHDYWRFSGEGLARLLSDSGFQSVRVSPLGRGPFTAAAQITWNALAWGPLRAFNSLIASVGDSIIRLVDRKKLFSKEFYPLGYIVVARK